MKFKFLQFISCYFLLFIAFFPVKIGSWDVQREITTLLFGGLTKILGSIFFEQNFKVDFSSDSISMLMLMLILAGISLLITLFLSRSQQLVFFTQKIAAYYIAIILLKYGVDKLFKSQFYLPEPNILFSKFGALDQDILFWSLMGTSRTYSVLLGIIEISVAVLLLFKKTRMAGLIVAFFTLINILIVNFSFDISVKFFSITLLLMAIFALKDICKPLFDFIVQQKPTKIITRDLKIAQKFQPFLFPLKILLFGIVFLQIFLPYFTTQNWNDDFAQRPLFHGAYEVKQINSSQKNNLKYIFFHRDQYVIVMDQQDRTCDFPYRADTLAKEIIAMQNDTAVLKLNYKTDKNYKLTDLQNENIKLKLKEIDWKKMPALQQKLHWLVEEIK